MKKSIEKRLLLKVIKLSEYAKRHGVTYRTVWNKFKEGKIPNAYKDEFGNILVKIETPKETLSKKVAIYARVSSNENKSNLNSQAERLKNYAIAKGYTITHIVKEVGSGVNDNRKKLLKLLQKDYGILIVEHKDRLTRFGFNFIKTLLEDKGVKVEVVNEAEDETSDLMQDLISIIYSFSARMYGLRRSKRKTEEIIKCLQEEDND